MLSIDVCYNHKVSYPLYVTDNYREALSKYSFTKALLVTDKHISDLYLGEFSSDIDTLIFNPGESTKSLESVSAIWDKLHNIRADRTTILLSIGGGVINDIAGFAASCYMRGIDWIQVSTTLLAQVDAGVGSKTAINYQNRKNLIGNFYHPVMVINDTKFLSSLDKRQFLSGLAEVVKYAIACDREFFYWLEKNQTSIMQRDPDVLQQMVYQCCRIKSLIVKQDLTDKLGIRAKLNFGHTFAHALESITNFKQYLHGEAVAIGMSMATKLAYEQQILPLADQQRILALLQQFGLIYDCRFAISELVGYMLLDKKTECGKLNILLPSAIGEVQLAHDLGEPISVE